MTYDLQIILIIAGAAILLLLLLWLLVRGRRQSIAPGEAEREAGDPYAATKERPYMKRAAAPSPPAPPAVEAGDVPLSPAPPPPRPREVDIAQPAMPLPGDLAGIAFPPHSTDHQDDLTRLKGVGPKLAALLHEEGITQYSQLASLGDDEVIALDARLGTFKGRLVRDRVAEQARLLASGDRAGFEERFGKLGG